ncbi:MAG: gamma-glutamyl-gamma-aminobutyrate hydrolase family protein, partial [Myxococcales bacterium]|nr:gamma-glutamyl-gamma-aminobutyrate hydrolase family protein [Myxococcales bacterium]
MRPVVGIPVSLDARGRLRRGRATLFSDRAYARAVAACGGAPVLLPTDAPERAADVIAHVDALLLPGGDDFPPARARADYPDGVFELADPEQVAFDAALLRASLAAAMPTLGICYGMQLMALEAGGALHAHLPVDAPSEVAHGGSGAPPAVHAIAIEA